MMKMLESHGASIFHSAHDCFEEKRRVSQQALSIYGAFGGGFALYTGTLLTQYTLFWPMSCTVFAGLQKDVVL